MKELCFLCLISQLASILQGFLQSCRWEDWYHLERSTYPNYECYVKISATLKYFIWFGPCFSLPFLITSRLFKSLIILYHVSFANSSRQYNKNQSQHQYLWQSWIFVTTWCNAQLLFLIRQLALRVLFSLKLTLTHRSWPSKPAFDLCFNNFQ